MPAVTLLPASAYDREVLRDLPKGYWPLWEPAGAASCADLANANAATVNGSGVTFGGLGPLPYDPANRAPTMTGVNAFLRADAPVLSVGNVCSVECWFRRDPASFGVSVSICEKGTNAYAVRFETDNTLSWRKSGVANFATTPAITDTVWHHLACTKNGSARHIWLDTVDVAVLLTDQTLLDVSSAFIIGASGGGGTRWWNGGLARVAVYGTELSAARVAAHFNAGKLALAAA